MSIRIVDRKLLWGRSANRCAWPDCHVRLTESGDSPEAEVLAQHGAVLGEEAHIRSGQTTGPRFDPDFATDAVDTYGNLILLCPTHHSLIDKNAGEAWTAEYLMQVKRDHEDAVDRFLGSSERQIRDLDERIAARIELWETRLCLAEWKNISFQLNQPTPTLDHRFWRGLFRTGEWMLSLDWPPQYPRIGRAFENHRLALLLMTNFLAERMIAVRGDRHEVDDPHHRIEWDPPKYERLMADRQVSCSGIYLLTLELTRSINYVIAAVRSELDHFYRFNDGMALVSDGDVIFGAYLERVEYSSDVDLLPANPDYESFESNLTRALREHESRYGRELPLAPIKVGDWATRRD